MHATLIRSEFRVRISAEYPPLSRAEGCISVPPLEKASFPFPLVAQEKRSIPLSIVREKMRFPFEFLHLNEARGIRSRRRRLIYIYIYNPVSNSFARTTVALRPAPVILHPSVSIVFLHFSTQETASLVDLFISSCFALRRLASFSLFIVVYSFPFFARFVPFPPRSVLDVFVVVALTTMSSFRLDFDVAQEPPISGNWLRHGGLECSIQSFHFFFSMGITSSFPVCLFPLPSSLLFPSFILFTRFPFLFSPFPIRRRFETTRSVVIALRDR